jgi:peptidoglycan/xylan/chitin deacetylase (PgdA/CDA1 family)
MLSGMTNSSMPREALLRCGGFDEQFQAREDLELGLRLWKMGLPFRCLPAAVAYEIHVKSSENSLRMQAKAVGAGDLRASRKHPEYRPYSEMASLANTRSGKKWLRNALMRSPVSLVPLLFPPLRFENWIYRWTPLRRLFVHFFSVAERITRLRGALDAAGSWDKLRSEFDRRAPALLYHHVGPSVSGSPQAISISPEHFERQIRWLARRGFTGIRPSDWLRWRREGTGLPEKPIIITFDGAYADTAECALPILRRYGFGAVVFVATGQVGGTKCLDDARGSGSRRLMSAEQIRYWSGQGIEFGAHGRTHTDLTKLSASDISAEVVGSKNDLSALLGSPPICFAYPYGAYNEAVRDLVQREFDLAFGEEEGLNYLQNDPHVMRRIHIGPTTSILDFAL